MLPPGVAADLVAPAVQRQWTEHFPPARVVVTLRRGFCACALTGRISDTPDDDERRLRTRYRRAGADRMRVIAALERHRGARRLPGSPGSVLAGFVGEHARNAGASLYLLDFSVEPERMPPWPETGPTPITATEVRLDPESWLPEQTPILVSA